MPHCSGAAMGTCGLGLLLSIIGCIMFGVGWNSASKAVSAVFAYEVEGKTSFTVPCEGPHFLPDVIFLFKEKGDVAACDTQVAATSVTFTASSGTAAENIVLNKTCGERFNPDRPDEQPPAGPALRATNNLNHMPASVEIVARRLGSSDEDVASLIAEARKLEEEDKEFMARFAFKDHKVNENVQCIPGTYKVTSNAPMWARFFSDKAEAVAGGIIDVIKASLAAMALCCFGSCCMFIGFCVAICSDPPGRMIG